MSSREAILSALKANQPALIALPQSLDFEITPQNITEQFINVLSAIGGQALLVNSYDELLQVVRERFDVSKRVYTNIPALENKFGAQAGLNELPHTFNNVELSILEGHFGVAENGAIWLTELKMGHRVLPFVCQHLALIINKKDLVANMHEAYKRIGKDNYAYGAFIAGPSKTADIEQSLVLGAHGPRSLIVFLIDND